MTHNAAFTNEYLDIARAQGGDIAGRRSARAYMLQSSAIVHHLVVDSSFLPRLFDQDSYNAFKTASETAHRILCKVIEHYLDDPSYRKVFEFDARLEELISLPRGYDAVLPFARVDSFLNEDTLGLQFCEFNADGSAGMNENREITNSICTTATYRAFCEHHSVQSCSLFEPWVEEFIGIYESSSMRRDHATFAICDYLDHGVVDEFKEYAKLFEQRGYPCIVEDVRNLRFTGSELRDGSGQRIDAIWRRCVTNDVIEFWDESQDLINAVRAGAVALIGSFAGHIVHDKQLFIALRDPRTQSFLTAEECSFIEDTIPETHFLRSACVDMDSVRADKDSWIIKPTDHYGADQVYAGLSVDQTQWEELLERFIDGRAGCEFLVQRYVHPFQTQMLPCDIAIETLSDEQIDWTTYPYNNINGLYLYNGRFAGIFSRLGPMPTVSKDMKGLTAATLWVDCDAIEEPGRHA